MEFMMDNNLSLKKEYGSFSRNDPSMSNKRQNFGSLVNQVYLNGKIIMADQFHENDGSMATLMQILVFCNDNRNEAVFENALLDFAAARGFHKKLFDKIIPKITQVKMDGEPATGSAIIALNGRYRLVTKDKPERLLGRCNKISIKGKTVPLTMHMIARVKSVYQQMSLNNLKVIMLAFADLENIPDQLEPLFQTDGLTLVGMIGLDDLVSGINTSNRITS